MSISFVEEINKRSDIDLLNYANLFRDSSNNLSVCKIIKDKAPSYNYIPLPVTEGPMERNLLRYLCLVMAKGIMDQKLDMGKLWAITEADRGGGVILGAFQALTGINIHWASWYDRSTIQAFGEDFLVSEMSPRFIMGSTLNLGLYLPLELKKRLQEYGVIILDDVISSGKTIFAIKSLLDMASIPLRGIVCAVEKVDYEGGAKIRDTLQVPFITIAKIKIRELTSEEKKASNNLNIIGSTETIGPRDEIYYT